MLTGVSGGMMRDVLLAGIPTVLRADLYAIAALGCSRGGARLPWRFPIHKHARQLDFPT
jgi:uncharacterized membrane protein YeiH